ncbi:hypothetical protein [Hufsiella ginkgonis]|uniref:Uncharacterized protein n=1 Tax=Hufsiella ginkgonis TaxID=2695274 RepID=A0A7K1XYI6_9SPHI|nr:hypothetical protein [Hufsiella ginkgonis]MXV15897.1 hypothetical protein [Hufsiella ginkgonis]
MYPDQQEQNSNNKPGSTGSNPGAPGGTRETNDDEIVKGAQQDDQLQRLHPDAEVTPGENENTGSPPDTTVENGE